MNAPLPVTGRPQPLQTGVKLRGAEKVARIPVKILPTEEIPRKPEWIRVPIATSPEVARVKALLRRSVLGGERLQQCGALVYDLGTRRFTLGDELLVLTSREQAVLEALIARPGRVMSKEQLAAQVFGLDEEASPDAIEIYIHRLRKKLDGQAVAIVTFRGLGYLLEGRDV